MYVCMYVCLYVYACRVSVCCENGWGDNAGTTVDHRLWQTRTSAQYPSAHIIRGNCNNTMRSRQRNTKIISRPSDSRVRSGARSQKARLPGNASTSFSSGLNASKCGYRYTVAHARMNRLVSRRKRPQKSGVLVLPVAHVSLVVP